ncbi:MAG: biotin/lipoate A/B protein ligase family protein [Woeseiaceae bacterium]|jgi:lipoate-protein ligase A|nr:biotin/lipoate A/B protein ligase family protein [Woeseiaceae bacterium]
MGDAFRIIDTGVREGRANIAFDAALIEARQNGLVPDTIRFLRFPPTALIGRHQDLRREVDLEYCAEHGIGLVRRITGGGAIYLDESQLGWELVFDRRSLGVATLPEVTAKICTAAAEGLSKLGVDARFRPRNDIEVDGRKISGTGGFYDGDILIYQGTVLIDLDAERMVRALRVPDTKLGKRKLDSAAGRVVTLADLLGSGLPTLDEVKSALLDGFCEGLGLEADWGDITDDEEALARHAFDEEIGTDEYLREIDGAGSVAGVLAGSHTSPGGTIDAFVRLDGPTDQILQRVLLTGDFFVTPPRFVLDLEAHLAGTRLGDVAAAIDDFFASNRTDTLSVQPADFRHAIEAALGERVNDGM